MENGAEVNVEDGVSYLYSYFACTHTHTHTRWYNTVLKLQ